MAGIQAVVPVCNRRGADKGAVGAPIIRSVVAAGWGRLLDDELRGDWTAVGVDEEHVVPSW